MYFRNLVLSAFIIAIVAGLIFSAYQAFFITPIILSSEVYEILEPVNHQIEAWSPADGMERNAWSFGTNFLLCFAYALMLLSAMSVKPEVTAIKGLFWGIAAYLTLFVAPALGLPPEIPGMEAAYLEGRQVWWLVTVIFTAVSLWMIAFQSLFYKGVGVVLIIIPHIFGTPQPETHGFANTEPIAIEALTTLWHQFIIQTSIGNALLWLVMGASAGFLIKCFINPLDTSGQ